MSGDDDTVCVAADGVTVEIDIAEAADATGSQLTQTIAMALRAAVDVLGPVQGAVTIIVVGDERIRQLNKEWRGLDKPTNVLSFAYPPGPGPERYLGDIAISHETATREAAAEGKSFRDHIAHLSVHGFLHLLGYDHETDDAAEEMERLERAILTRVGVPDPYIAQSA